MESQNPVAAFGLDVVGVDLNRHGEGPIEAPDKTFAAMQSRLVAVLGVA